MKLKNKVAIITGGSKGIGRATALALAKAGCHIAISGRTGTLLNSVADEIENAGRQAFVFIGDMAVKDDIVTFVQSTIDKFGQIDILVNNAGVGIFHTVNDLSVRDWDTMFNINIRGMFLMAKACLPHLRQARESVIVNVASLAGKNAFAGGAGYVATKAAVLGFSRCLMLEERHNGVRTLAICPGSVDTDFFKDQQDIFKINREKILQPDDVAETIVNAIRLPQRAMVSELDIRPAQP